MITLWIVATISSMVTSAIRECTSSKEKIGSLHFWVFIVCRLYMSFIGIEIFYHMTLAAFALDAHTSKHVWFNWVYLFLVSFLIFKVQQTRRLPYSRYYKTHLYKNSRLFGATCIQVFYNILNFKPWKLLLGANSIQERLIFKSVL